MKKYDFSDERYIPLSELEDISDDLLQAGDKVTSGAGYWVWEAAKERSQDRVRELKQ